MDADSPRPLRKRLLKWLLIATVGLVLLGIIGPMLAAPLIRGRVVSEIEKGLAARATIEKLSFDLGGSVHLTDLALEDLAGRPLLSVASVDVEAAVLAAIGGSYEADVTVDGFEVHVRRDADGRWNLAELAREGDEQDAASEEAATEPGSASVPPVASRVRFTNGLVIVHGAAGETELREVTLSLDVDGLERPSAYSLAAQLHGPAGPGGRILSSGEVVVAGDPHGSLELLFEDVLFAALEPALALALPVESVEGRLSGKGVFDLGAAGELLADMNLALDGLRVAGTREGAPAAEFGPIQLALHADADANHVGVQELTFKLGQAGTVAYAGTSRSSVTGGVEASGDLTLDGDLAALNRLAATWVPTRAGTSIEGSLTGTSHVELEDLAPRKFDLGLRVQDVAARGSSGELLDLGELSHAKLGLSASFPAEGAVSVESIDARLGPVKLTGVVRASGLDGSPGELDLDGTKLDLDADLESLGRNLSQLVDLGDLALAGSLRWTLECVEAQESGATAALRSTLVPDRFALGDLALEGEPLKLLTTLFAEGESGWRVEGTLDAPTLRVSAGEGRTLAQNAARATYRAQSSGVEGAPLELQVSFESDTLRATATSDEADPAAYRVTLAAGIENILRDAGAFLGLADHRGSGALTLDALIRSSDEALSAAGEATVADFVWVVPETPERAAAGIEDPRVHVDFGLTRSAPPEDVASLDVAIDSTFLAGTLVGKIAGLAGRAEGAPLVLDAVRGNFEYVPDRIGAFLAPWLPGTLSGAEKQEVALELDGELQALDVPSILAQVRGNVGVGVGLFETSGLATSGRVDVVTGEGLTAFTGDLKTNGGTLGLEASLRPKPTEDEPARAHLKVDLSAVNATAGTASLLALAHPAFASIDGLRGGQLGGLITGGLDLEYAGPLTLAELRAGWKELPKDLISGSGSLRIDDALLEGSGLLSQMLNAIGLDTAKSMSLEPLAFHIDSGRLKYDKAWTWNFSGTETTFTGSVGLDETLKMKWNVPVTKALTRKYSFLDTFEGETLAIPIGGTSTRPKLEWQGVMNDLAKKALTRRATKELGLGGIGDLKGLLGGGKKDSKSKEDPQGLFDRAGALWDEGDKKAARKLYEDLRKDHKESDVYTENKKLIKERAAKSGGS